MKYFDHAASTVIYPQVLDLLRKSFQDDFANPQAQHILGTAISRKIDIARSYFLAVLNAAKDDSFIFTSSATESNNTVIKGLNLSVGDVVLYSKADHPSLVAGIEELALEKNLILKVVPLDKTGSIIIDEFKMLLDATTKLVALSHVNNQSGVLTDIEIISKLVKEKSRAHLHIDAVQSFTKINLNVEGIDSLSITAHKIGGPKGIAGLYLKKNHNVKPLLLGGGQESGLRSGTPAYPLIAAFAEASRISLGKRLDSYANLIKINEALKTKLTSLIPEIKFPFAEASPYIVTFIVPKIPSDVLLRHMEARGFYLSSTSACSSKQKGFNPTLAALNIAESFHKNVLRLSFSHDTDQDEVNLLLMAFSDVWRDLAFLTKK